jgi:DNA repair exonuclease SbcCD ATPase subunit
MITIKNVTMKNFMSVGNNTQAIILNDNALTLILGENIDQGSSGSRNGVGKTTMVQAICFAIFGVPLTNIKKDNLVNKTNLKGMAVTLEYEVDGKSYKIERGRKPNFLHYYVNDDMVNAPDSDEAHGESKITQQEIEKVFGMSHAMFRHLVALHTKTTPFLSEGANKQRELIEELISITQLSQKAESLKQLIKEIKDEIRDEEVRLKTMSEGNERIQKAINDLNFRSNLWEREHAKKLENLAVALVELEQIDVEKEIAAHKLLVDWDSLNSELLTLDKEFTRLTKSVTNHEQVVQRKQNSLTSAQAQTCPTCAQGLHTEEHAHIADRLSEELETARYELSAARDDAMAIESAILDTATRLAALGDRPTTAYKNLEQAYEHRNSLDQLRSNLERESMVENPYLDQIANLSETALQEVNYDYINELTTMKEHQDFLLKLLISKDSFIRKKVIDQNLSYLNFRLGHYLTKLQLPHDVEFKSDLSVEITQLGKDFDFEQLSNGEANRLILSLAWAFRDVWESMNHKLNLLIIDELVDSGMDGSGTDSALEILKEMCRVNGKSIFLISHKDGLETRVDRVAIVQKENNFTTYVSFTEDM